MDFGLLPPEVNSGLMYAGPGSGPMLAAAAVWDAVAAELESAASGYSSTVSGLTGQAWSGPSSVLMTAAVTPYVEWLQATAAQAGQTAVQAYGAAAAYEAAFAATVPPPVIAANRAQLAALVATNFFGQNTPAIAATEAQYAEMWVQDATAMSGYASASQAASALAPLSEPPRTTNPAGQVAQARAVTQATGTATAARTQSLAQLSSSGVSQALPPGVVVDQGGTYNVASGATIQVASGGTVHIYSGGTLNIASGGTLTVGSNGVVDIYSGGTLNIASGGTLNVGAGSVTVGSIGVQTGVPSIITVGPSSTVNLAAGAEFVAKGGSMLVTNGSTLNVASNGMVGSGIGGSFTINGSTVNVGPGATFAVNPFGQSYASTVTITGSTVTEPSGVTVYVATSPDGTAGTVVINLDTVVADSGSYALSAGSETGVFDNIGSVLTIGPAAGASSAPSGLVPLGGLPAAPGLAGTSGIQPQLNAALLSEWARTVSGAEIAADLAGAAG